jgi:hypothetical protein
MKKFIKWFLVAIVALVVLVLAAAIIIPIVFKPQLMEMAKTEINKNVNAKVEFSDFKVSILKGFPDVYIGLMNLSVVGINDFEGDTLVAFREFSVRVDIKSVFAMKNILVKSVLLDSPTMNAIVNRDGKVNWDIAIPSEAAEEPTEEPATEESSAFKASLKKFEIRNAKIRYIDLESDMKATLANLNFLLSGNMGLDYTTLKMSTTVEKFNFYMDGIRFMKDASLGFDAEIGADLVNSVYKFNDNVFSLNDLTLKFDGEVRMPTDDIDVDIVFATKKADFKSLLSLVPAIYMTDFEGLKTSGKLSLDGFVKGTVGETTLPNVSMNLMVDNARFQYPDLPKSAENINVDAKIFYDGINDDKTTVDVNKFHIELGGNPFDATLTVRTPMSDMQLAGAIKGIVDFGTLADVVPMEETTIKGILDCNLAFGGLMSYIEKEQYDKFKADGDLKLRNFEFVSPDMPQGIKIVEAILSFSPKYVQLANFDARMGNSDFRMNGRLENFIPFALKDETLKGNLNFFSSLIDVNEIMGESSETEEIPQDTIPMSIIEIPKNIDFTLAADVKKILYDKMEIEAMRGQIVVRNGVAKMNNLAMNMLQGSLTLNGEYSTQNVEVPTVDFAMDIKNFDIPSAVKSFGMLEKLAPQVKNLTGNVSSKLTLNAALDSTMGPILNTVNSKGRFASQNIAVVNSKVLGKAADLLKYEDLRNPKLKNLDAGFSVKDGVVTIEPFDTEMAGVGMNFGGSMTLDQVLDFKIKLDMPKSKLGPASDALNYISTAAAAKGVNVGMGDKVKIGLKVTGTATDPKVGIDGGDATQSVKEQVKEQVKEVVKEQVDKAKEEARLRAREEADKLIADAEKQADAIRKEADALAAKIRSEADAKAKKVEEEAKGKNPLVQQAAKKSADQIRKEGDASANKVTREADAKAQALVDKAKAEADKLLQSNP